MDSSLIHTARLDLIPLTGFSIIMLYQSIHQFLYHYSFIFLATILI